MQTKILPNMNYSPLKHVKGIGVKSTIASEGLRSIHILLKLIILFTWRISSLSASVYSGFELSGIGHVTGTKLDCMSLTDLLDTGICGLLTGCHSPTFGILYTKKFSISVRHK